MIKRGVLIVTLLLLPTGCLGSGGGDSPFAGWTRTAEHTYPTPDFDSTLVGVRPDGTPRWREEPLDVDDTQTIRLRGGGTLTGTERTVVARAADGHVLWRRADCRALRAMIRVPGGTTALGCDSTVTLVDGSGRDVWSLVPKRGYLVDGLVADADGSVYAYGQLRTASGLPDSDNASMISAVSASGRLRWQGRIDDLGHIDYDTGPDETVTVWSPVAAARGRLYIATFGHLIALSGRTGDLLWSWHTHTAAEFGAIVVGRDGTVYAAGGGGFAEGYVLAFDPDGHMTWAAETTASVMEAILAPDGSIYANDGTTAYRFRG
jgi:outer membrane protein assembly factor BamB